MDYQLMPYFIIFFKIRQVFFLKMVSNWQTIQSDK